MLFPNPAFLSLNLHLILSMLDVRFLLLTGVQGQRPCIFQATPTGSMNMPPAAGAWPPPDPAI